MTLIVNFTGALLLTLAVFGGVLAPATTAEASAERAVHLLEYIAVDYPAAVVDGKVVSELEFDEQISFVALVGDQLREIGVPDDDALLVELVGLKASIAAKGGDEVVADARRLAGSIRQRFRVATLPPAVPDLAHGKALYAEACVSCHGVTGHGDGPKAADHDPAPADFTDRERAFKLPLSAAYATITYGIDGTAMASFADAYDDQARFDLAFYVGSLAFNDGEIADGFAAVEADPKSAATVVFNVGQLVREPVVALAANEQERAIVAYLRSHPEALESSKLSFSLVRSRLAESRDAYVAGDVRLGVDRSIAAYLDGFEPLEPALSAIDRPLRMEIEAEFLRYRERMQAGAPAEEIEALYAGLRNRIDAASDVLDSGRFGPAAVFLSSLTVLAREGFEAILLVVALIGILVRAGQPGAIRYVHVGWVAALLAGGATWIAARYVIDIGGFERELIEGVTALIAMAILFYVSYWLIAKVSSQRWQAFLQRRIQSALGRGSLWTLVTISFVAVYREAFETLLFFEAIAAQAGSTGRGAMWAGAGTGLLLLLVLAAVTFRFGLRLPMRQFFVASSALLYLFAVMLAGHGIAALQEAGVVPTSSVNFVRLEWLGIYPTREGLALQGLLIVAALLAGVRAVTIARAAPESEKVTAPVSRS